MAGGGSAGGGAVGAAGGAGGAAAAVGAASAMSMTASVGALKSRSMQAATPVSSPAQSTHVSISSGARAALAAEGGHGLHGARASALRKLTEGLTADTLLAMMNHHKKHHHEGIGGALMAAEAIKMYQSVQAMAGTHAMGAATSTVTAPAAAHV